MESPTVIRKKCFKSLCIYFGLAHILSKNYFFVFSKKKKFLNADWCVNSWRTHFVNFSTFVKSGKSWVRFNGLTSNVSVFMFFIFFLEKSQWKYILTFVIFELSTPNFFFFFQKTWTPSKKAQENWQNQNYNPWCVSKWILYFPVLMLSFFDMYFLNFFC